MTYALGAILAGLALGGLLARIPWTRKPTTLCIKFDDEETTK